MRDFLIGTLAIIGGLVGCILAAIGVDWIGSHIPSWIVPLSVVIVCMLVGLSQIAPPIGRAIREYFAR